MTAQIPDTIHIEGTKHQLATLPLTAFFGSADPIPKLYDQPDAYHSLRHTALWRGYVGHWGLADTALVLNRLCIWGKRHSGIEIAGIEFMPTLEADLTRIFPGRGEPVLAYWYSGLLQIPYGDKLYYAHIGFGGEHRYERRITIENGYIVTDEMLDHTVRFLARFKTDSLDLDYPIVNGRACGVEPLCWLTDEGRSLIKEKLGVSVKRRGER